MAATKKGTKKASNVARACRSRRPRLHAGRAEGLQSLLTTYTAQLTPRLPATLAANQTADLTAMGVVVPAVKGAKEDAVQPGPTAQQTSALEQGYNMVTAVRKSVTRDRPARSVSLAYGVGAKMSKLVVKDVTNALTKIVNRATTNAPEAASYGITTGDVAAFTAQIAAIKAADAAQEAARAAAPQSTQQRNATAAPHPLRRSIASRAQGCIQFANSETERELFEALIQKAG